MLQLAARLIHRLLGVLRARWFLRKATSLGRGVRLGTWAWVRNEGSIRIGNGVCFHPGPTGMELVTMFGGALEIGDHTMINYGCSFTANRLVRIGQRCRFGVGVILTDSNLHLEDPARRSLRPDPSTIVIEDDVWIAHRVVVLPGVTLGKGCIVGACSVVTRSVPPGMMAAGNPARVIRPIHRDSDAFPDEESPGETELAEDPSALPEHEAGVLGSAAEPPASIVDRETGLPASSGFHVKITGDTRTGDAEAASSPVPGFARRIR